MNSAVVTGAGRGIGRAVAAGLEQDVRDEAAHAAAAAEALRHGLDLRAGARAGARGVRRDQGRRRVDHDVGFVEAPVGVRVHAVCPDGVAGDMVDAMDPAGRAKSIVHSSGRLLTAQEVADAALGLIGSRRVVPSLPAWRGGLTRLGQLLPSQSAGGFRLFELVGRPVMRRP